MPDGDEPNKTQPVRLPEPQPLATIHAIAFLSWQREWHEALEVRRARLLDVLARLHTQMQGGNVPMKTFLLGGETILLDDISAIRPELVTFLIIYNAGGRLSLGPWYVTVDEALVSGEALIRNLLVARASANRLGVKLANVVYDPYASGHIAQLPQILTDFDVDAAYLRHGAPVIHLPFRWQAPDGSNLLVVNHRIDTNWPVSADTPETVAVSVKEQREVRPDGPFLWLFNAAYSEKTLVESLQEVKTHLRMPVEQSDLRRYVAALRRELPDHMRPSIRGELRLQSVQPHTYLWPGTLSSRIYLKQANMRLQTMLSHSAEPLLALALTHGRVAYTDNLLALLAHSWKLLLQTQSRNVLGGCASDTVHEEHEIRQRQAEDAARHIIHRALDALPGQRSVGRPARDTYVVVWNSHNWPVEQVVFVRLTLPPGRFPAAVVAPDGDEVVFGWEDGVLGFTAGVPAVGYATYHIRLADAPTHIPVSATAGDSIGALFVQYGKLVWHTGDNLIEDVVSFHDGGDTGDVYNYSPPSPDLVVRADLLPDTVVETGPLFQRLVMRHQLRVAPQLDANRQRLRGDHILNLTTTATRYTTMPDIHFRTTFDNTVRDHRLRAHIRTGVASESVLSDTPFGLVPRPVAVEGTRYPNQPNVEGVINTHPVQSLAAVMDAQRARALLVQGLPEVEALWQSDQTTLALTLVRSVGWLSRDDLRTRTAAVAPSLAVPGAQCQRTIQADYAMVTTPPGDAAALLRAGMVYNAPLQAFQYDAPPDKLACSYLSIISNRGSGAASDGEGAIMTAFKPPEQGKGWIVRLFNPHERPVEVWITPNHHPDTVQQVTMAEDSRSYLHMDANGGVQMTIAPHEITTLRLTF